MANIEMSDHPRTTAEQQIAILDSIKQSRRRDASLLQVGSFAHDSELKAIDALDAAIAALRQQIEGQQTKEDGAVSATAGDAVSCSVPTGQLPHDDFIPHGATCEADHDNGSDWGRCGEIATQKHGDRYVCASHFARIPDAETRDAVLAEVERRVRIAERQGWANRSVPVRLLRQIAQSLRLAALESPREGTWLPIVDPIPVGTVLVTNNIRARDAYGRMSHVWRGDIIKANEPERTGAYVTFTDADQLVQGLTHYCHIPQPLPPSPTGSPEDGR